MSTTSSIRSNQSVVSLKTQKLLNEVAAKSQSHLFKLENKELNEETLKNCWDAFGFYLARQFKQGKAIHIPKWGTFTFTTPEVALYGVTNPGERNKLLREPVFIIGKDFVPGGNIIPGLATGQSVRPYELRGGSGSIPQFGVNYMEVCLISGTSKDTAKRGVERVIRQMSDKIRAGRKVQLDIPHVGTFMVRGNIAGVSFMGFLIDQAKNAIGVKMLNQQTLPGIPPLSLGGTLSARGGNSVGDTMQVTTEAERWIKDNLDPFQGENGVDKGKRREVYKTYDVNPGNQDEMSRGEGVAIDNFFGETADKRGPTQLEMYKGSQQPMRRYDSLQHLGRPQSEQISTRSALSRGGSHRKLPMRGLTPQNQHRTFEGVGEAADLGGWGSGDIGRAIEKMLECKARARQLCRGKDPLGSQKIGVYDLMECLRNSGVEKVDLEYLPQIVGLTGAHAESSEYIRYDIFLQKLPFVYREGRGGLGDGGNTALSTTSYKTTSAITELAAQVSIERARSLARLLHSNRHKLIQEHRKEGVRVMDKRSYSQLLGSMRKVDLHVEGRVLRALCKQAAGQSKELRILEVSPSLLDVLKAAQQILYGGLVEHGNEAFGDDELEVRADMTNTQVQVNPELVLGRIQELVYSSGIDLRGELVKSAGGKSSLSPTDFFTFIQGNWGREFNKKQVLATYHMIKGKVTRGSTITIDEMEKMLKWKIPFGDWETVAFRQIKSWFAVNKIGSDQAFEKMLAYRLSNDGQRIIRRVDFRNAMKSENFGFTAPQIDLIFELIDIEGRGYIDAPMWNERFCADENALQYLRDIILKYQFTGDDILHKMKLRIWDDPLDRETLGIKLRLLDPSLTNLQVRNVGKALKNKDNIIEVPFLIKNLTGSVYETVDFTKRLMTEIKQFLDKNTRYNDLRQYFEELDVNQSGNLTPLEFKAALERLNPGHSEVDLDRFVRMLEKTNSGRINYVEFLSKMSITADKNFNPFKAVVNRVNYFLTQNKITVNGIIKRLGKGRSDRKVTTRTFSEFIKNKVQKKKSMQELQNLADLIDIDQDGFIDEHDLQTCLNNLDNDSFFTNNGQNTIGFQNERKFYPTERLTDRQTFDFTAKLRQSLSENGISAREAFHKFDTNKDGFLSFSELSAGLDTLTEISQFYKEKLFAMMDLHSTGLLPFVGFVTVIEEGKAAAKTVSGRIDGFEWEADIIQKMKEWVQNRGLNVEDAFKNFDADFDGFIGKEDLRGVLVDLLKIPEEQIHKSRIDRLFRLLDQYKTNTIQLGDFRRLLEGEGLSMESTVNKTKMFNPTNTFDWKVNAIQQIGLVLSRQFASPEKSFESISENHNQLTYTQFIHYLDKSRALFGFNLTSPLLHKLFAQLDAHKKGTLSPNDWVNTFSKYNWRDQCLAELKNTIATNFQDMEMAYDSFLSFSPASKKRINEECFKMAVNSIAGNRFSIDDVQHLWKHFSRGASSIQKDDFTSILESIKFTGKSSLRSVTGSAKSKSKTKTLLKSLGGTTQFGNNSQYDGNPFAKLKNTLKSSFVNLDQVFLDLDRQNTGYVSNVQFRTAIRKLNLGLTAREIDRILNELDLDTDGRINWVNFTSRFAPTESDQRIAERARKTFEIFKNLILEYLISPKDAFIAYDKERKGYLTFAEFNEMLNTIYGKSHMKIPTFMIIKDLFEIVDIRKDGIIDLSEWQQTFKAIQLECLSPSSSGSSRASNNRIEIESDLLEWENTKQYADISYDIGKHRKILLQLFESKNIPGTAGMVGIKDGVRILETILRRYNLEHEQLRSLVMVGENRGYIDYKRLLEIFKNRNSNTNAFPKAHFI